ncbi:hypothetical protein ABT173_47945 [Streptomyces sp. NPDC001795]|uniref:GntT/GntP/DsdX family permease n=1 Tax=Streptomyces sp. NPDC001795 TaxID=3154525 RepID=UPI003332A3CF
MSHTTLLIIAVAGVAALLLLILKGKVQPFVALVVVSIGVALAAGVPAADLMKTIEEGMGATLGHIATIIALGAMIGRIVGPCACGLGRTEPDRGRTALPRPVRTPFHGADRRPASHIPTEHPPCPSTTPCRSPWNRAGAPTSTAPKHCGCWAACPWAESSSPGMRCRPSAR